MGNGNAEKLLVPNYWAKIKSNYRFMTTQKPSQVSCVYSTYDLFNNRFFNPKFQSIFMEVSKQDFNCSSSGLASYNFLNSGCALKHISYNSCFGCMRLKY